MISAIATLLEYVFLSPDNKAIYFKFVLILRSYRRIIIKLNIVLMQLSQTEIYG